MKNLNIYQKLFIVLVVILSALVFVNNNQANALTIADKNGNPSACPDISPNNTKSCTIFITSITVNGYTDSDTSSSARNTAVKGGYVVPNKTVNISWTKTGATPGAYLVRFGCGNSIDFANDNNTIGWTTSSTSLSWSIPSWVANYKYCKVWVYAEEKYNNTTNNPTLGVSNTRAFTVEEEADPISVACYTTPTSGKTDQEIKIYAEVTGGTSPYSYSWSGDVSGSSRIIYKTFTTQGLKSFKVTVTDEKNQTKSATCSISITEDEQPATRYDCNQTTYQCNASYSGQYTSLSKCKEACVYNPPVTRFECNQATYQCNTSSFGRYTTLSACQAECNYNPPTTRYECNQSTYQCNASSFGRYTTLGECQAECNYTPPTNRYACNRITFACNVSSLGEYNSYSACAAECIAETPLPRYDCNQSTYQCNASSLGQYASYTECFYACQKPVTKYSCNQTTGQCVQDSNGLYTDLATCNNACAKKNITVDLSANPTIIDRGQTSVLTWTSSGATYCVASNGWSGSKSIYGSEVTTPSVTTVYTITCYNEYTSASDTVTVTVRDINPSVDLSVYPSTIYRGQTSVLTWTSNSVNSCYASNGWSGSKSTYGNETVAPTSTTTYTITCNGTNGSTVSDTVVVNVLDQQTDQVLAITKLARNLSNGDRTYSKVINAKQGDVIEFYLLVSNIHSSKYANNTIVIDRLPAPLSYYANTTKIDSVQNVDGIASVGINLGTFKPGDKKIITFQAIANQTGTYYTITNTAEAKADDVTTVSDTATITYSYVLGASTIATGPMETGMIITGLSILITGATWAYVTKNENGKKFLKKLEDRQIQKKIDSLKN